MQNKGKSVLIVAMPFAETSVPSIQISLIESYLKERNINVSSKHLYLKTADFYTLNNYNYLINSPNDPYISQMIFSKYLYANHWEKNFEKFRYYYEDIISNKEFLKKFSFEEYIKKTDIFLNWALKEINWESYDIIGFSLNYGQFLPSLALSKNIKEKYPEKTIVLGGSTTIKELGKNVLKTFDFIDFIVSGEGEEALYLLATDFEKYKQIPGLIYRENKEIIWNRNDNYINLNNLPYPDFQSYYNDLSTASDEIKQYFSLFGKIPIELSRGCWWNRCTFCNIRTYDKNYREKEIKRFVEELNFLSDKYRMLTFQIIANTLPQNDFHDFCKKIIELGKDFDLYIEARAGRLKSSDYTLLKKAGFNHIQTGIETFSTNLIKKMNKGARVIDNIAALKYCKENNISNIYNLIVNYPNEEKIDFEETKRNIQLFKQYIEPPQISKFIVGFGSPIYENFESFNIESFEPKTIDTIMYPPEILKNNFFFFNQFKRKHEIKENNWKNLVISWKDEFEKRKINAVKRKTTLTDLVFYFIDGKTFLKIIDARNLQNVMIYGLNKLERDIFLACIDVISFESLKEKFPDASEEQVKEILNSFEEAGIVFRENNNFLSLPLNYGIINNKRDIKREDSLIKVLN